MPHTGSVTSHIAGRRDVWRAIGWAVLAIAAAAYYGRYAKTIISWSVYMDGARCLWDGQVLLECASDFTYPPALALAMIPFLALSSTLQLVIWYLISIVAAVACVARCEALVRRLYPSADSEPNATWIRVISLLLSLKFILSVLTYQSYDLLVFCLILLGLWALASGRALTAGGILAVVTALKATPLMFLPYLLLKRRFAAALVFIVVLALCCVLPDLFSVLKGGRSDYFENWISQVVGPALTPGGSSSRFFWHTWMGQSHGNLSLRGVMNRLVREPIWGVEPRAALAMSYVVVAAAIALLLALSARRDKLIAVDGAILLIGMLALSPISSRYHFILLMLPYTVLAAACLCDRRMRAFGAVVLFMSFILATGTSNDVGGQTLAEFSHAHGFLLAGALILLVPLGRIIWMERLTSGQAGSDDLSAGKSR